MMQACYTCNKLFSDEYALAQHRCSSAAQPDPKDSARVREPGAVTPHLKPEVVFGVKTYSDPSLPPGEIHIRLDGKTVGRIINVGPDARITQPERDQLQARVEEMEALVRRRERQHADAFTRATELERERDAALAESNKLDSELGSALAANQRLEAASARMREALETVVASSVTRTWEDWERRIEVAREALTQAAPETGGKDGG